MKLYVFLFVAGIFLSIPIACKSERKTSASEDRPALQQQISRDSSLTLVEQKALEVVRNGFNAGDGYMEVWIRDYNTFITLASKVHDHEALKENLKVFFRLQGKDGGIVDGFIPKDKATSTPGGYEYIFTDLEPMYAGHKNTVETDQESSLIQAVYNYVDATGDTDFLAEEIGGISIVNRMEIALEFLMKKRYNEKYGLLYGATTADWGDVQPEHEWGVFLTDDTHYAIDIYDNAMFLIALDNFMELASQKEEKWKPIKTAVAEKTMEHLWDATKNKFIPHIYINKSPFPADFNENEIFYHGGTAVAIQAGLLNRDQVKASLDHMLKNMENSGAQSLGLTLYPPYPAGYFLNKGMYPYGYQNGGDWTWFGARMILALLQYDLNEEAYKHLHPMLDRVIKNNGFYEWYTIGNEPMGSATFKGSAGVLYNAIQKIKEIQ